MFTCNALLKGFQDKKILEKAFELMDQMREERCTPDKVTMDALIEWLHVISETDRLKRLCS